MQVNFTTFAVASPQDATNAYLYLHRCSEGCQCNVVVRGIGQELLMLPYASSLQPKQPA